MANLWASFRNCKIKLKISLGMVLSRSGSPENLLKSKINRFIALPIYKSSRLRRGFGGQGKHKLRRFWEVGQFYLISGWNNSLILMSIGVISSIFLFLIITFTIFPCMVSFEKPWSKTKFPKL